MVVSAGAAARTRALDARIPIGRNLAVSPVCLGSVAEPKLVEAAFEAGINFFFMSSDMHWPVYDAVRRGLAGLLKAHPSRRGDLVIAAVSYVTQPEFCHVPFHETIRAVEGLDGLDMTIIGGVHPDNFMRRLLVYREHRERGPLRIPGVTSTGATFHDRRTAGLAANHGLVDAAFVRYNPLHPGAEDDLFPFLRKDRSCAIFNFNSTRGCYSDSEWARLSLPPADWRPLHADYYRFALARPEIDGLLVSLKSEAELRALADAMCAAPLTQEQLEYLHLLGDLAAGRAALCENAV
jgi:hypothetical protein